MKTERRQAELGVVDGEEMIATGYAATFDQPYVMYRDRDGYEYREQIARGAISPELLRDVVLNYNHGGRVCARQSNGTLQLTIDDIGLGVRADLSKTSAARELHEDIRAGMVTKMSWAFNVEEDAYTAGDSWSLRTIEKVGAVFDVSAVAAPANPETSIEARNRHEKYKNDSRRKRLRLKYGG